MPTYDPRYRWQTLETPHFQLHFHQGEEALVRQAAGAAERAHALLAPVLGHVPTARTQIVLTDDTDDENGLASPLPYDQVHLQAVPPDSLSELNDYTDWVMGLVAHEYTHILQLDTVEGAPALVNAVLGKVFVPNGFTPSWLIEGIAVLHESPPGHGRNASALFDMYARAIVLEGRPLPARRHVQPAARLAPREHPLPPRRPLPRLPPGARRRSRPSRRSSTTRGPRSGPTC